MNINKIRSELRFQKDIIENDIRILLNNKAECKKLIDELELLRLNITNTLK